MCNLSCNIFSHFHILPEKQLFYNKLQDFPSATNTRHAFDITPLHDEQANLNKSVNRIETERERRKKAHPKNPWARGQRKLGQRRARGRERAECTHSRQILFRSRLRARGPPPRKRAARTTNQAAVPRWRRRAARAPRSRVALGGSSVLLVFRFT